MNVPPQLQQQMFELSTQLSETVNQLKVTEANAFALENERRRQELTLNEISGQNEEALLYKPVGKLYIRKSKNEMVVDLTNKIRRTEVELEEARRKLETLSKKRDEVSTNIQELVASVSS
ncbi:unnamed protein product [Blepharisma stoltei]|uniref:Prefoldin subunit 1 n=1 Tax=Blepharisma stoltei TaxID=1481888 RepID=A0AAU9J871_9CILI|nr:unnamed protein product [Blepharisma stoltei]